MPKKLYDFVSDSKRHDLEEQSLHDTWLNEIAVKVKRDKENRSQAIGTSIKIELLGSYHDRIFQLHFIDVFSYQFQNDNYPECDLLTYEIYHEMIENLDYLVFNAEFADETAIIIKSKEISIIENIF